MKNKICYIVSYILSLNEKNNNKINNIGSNRNINHNLSEQLLIKRENYNYLDIIAKQKNDIRKLLLKKNIINRRFNYNYMNNNSQINSSGINHNLNNILIPNINNKSSPKKINNYNHQKK